MSGALDRLCLAYAAHVGARPSPDELREGVRRRLAAWPAWARVFARTTAFLLLWAGPLAVLGRPRRLDRLSPDDLDLLLSRLQRARRPAARGAFLAVKSIVLPCCYPAGDRP